MQKDVISENDEEQSYRASKLKNDEKITSARKRRKFYKCQKKLFKAVHGNIVGLCQNTFLKNILLAREGVPYTKHFNFSLHVISENDEQKSYKTAKF